MAVWLVVWLWQLKWFNRKNENWSISIGAAYNLRQKLEREIVIYEVFIEPDKADMVEMCHDLFSLAGHAYVLYFAGQFLCWVKTISTYIKSFLLIKHRRPTAEIQKDFIRLKEVNLVLRERSANSYSEP